MRTSCLLFLYSLFVACGASGVRISFDTTPKPTSFNVEIAKTPEQVQQGLMNRKSLAATNGMLFIFPDQQTRAFWMKNTLISLDMIFMDSQKKIIGIIENVAPQTLDLRTINQPSQYVLEIGGGLAAQKGLKIGQKASWSF